ncbi:proteasome assembly chaperone 4 isoform X3 [Artibeus jamaicensis]|uniref:proteasome assembly chaperone 4 isoform X3 n=1 Tax=Artibeus jamaicensis TaxID=9417 RepID=UPI00235AB318|nr:proteasome assembly chaperone 4 isoform X3 [Artibeus jamaicensis]
MEGPQAAAGGPVSLHNFSARLWEQLVHFHVMRLTDSLFLWVGATPHLRNLAVAMCSRYSRGPRWPGRAQVPLGDGALCSLPGPEAEDSIPVSTSLLGDTSDTTSTGLAQRLGGHIHAPMVSPLPACCPETPMLCRGCCPSRWGTGALAPSPGRPTSRCLSAITYRMQTVTSHYL